MFKKRKRSINPIDLSEVLRDYENEWVVLSYDYKSVLHSGEKAEDVFAWSDKGIVMKVPRFDGSFTPEIHS